MVDPTLTFKTTKEAIEARETLISKGVVCYIGKRKITYRSGQKQLGKQRDVKQHRPFTHCGLGMIRQLANGQIAITFNFLHVGKPAPYIPKSWDLIPITQAYA